METTTQPVKAPPRKRYDIFLNPYEDYACTKCPKCDHKTKLRKFPLVIHVEPKQILVLNKSCRFCTECELLIAKKSEVEALMADKFEAINPDIVSNEYLVFGTLDKGEWRMFNKSLRPSGEVIEHVYVFKDALNFEINGGWYCAGDKK
jgi:hypothetical protein